MRSVRTASSRLIHTRWFLHLVQVAVVAIAAFGAAPASAQDAEKARQLFQQGSKYYDLGQFDKAIEAWQQGYDQKPDPGFLYNIAQAYRQKQDAAKAIFFYKGYLRNSPKAHNRSEVEQKIAALQKQLDTTAATTPPPPNNTPPPPNNTTPPPSNVTPPGPTVSVTPTEPPPDPNMPPPPPPNFSDTPPTTLVQSAPSAFEVSSRRIDGTAAIGPAFWSSGVNGTAKPSFVLTLTLGYYFGAPMSRIRFRMGGLLGYTFLEANDDGSTVGFWSFLLDPMMEIRLSPSGRLYADLDLGLGIQMLTGMKKGSHLLAANENLTVDGAQGMFETRIAVAVGYRWTPDLALFSSLANSDSKKKQHFYADITRVEWLFGAAYRF
jgi:hypothetical protein